MGRRQRDDAALSYDNIDSATAWVRQTAPGGPMTREECDAALGLIAETLAHPLHPHATVV